MAILVDRNTRLLAQGIPGREGRFHALACRDYGTPVMAGVASGRGGLSLEGIPVFNSSAEPSSPAQRGRAQGRHRRS